MQPELRSVLYEGARELDCPISESQADSLLAYLELLGKWNKVYNLTAVREPLKMVTYHLLDCLSIVAPLRAHLGQRRVRLLDAGSGAGLPGLVIAVLLPQLAVTCVDAVGKKTRFIGQAAGELGLPNLTAIHGRIEDLDPLHCEVITARALSSLADLAAKTVRHLTVDGIWLAMKGKHPSAEIEALPGDVHVFHVEQMRVPSLEADRCLVWMRRPQPAELAVAS